MGTGGQSARIDPAEAAWDSIAAGLPVADAERLRRALEFAAPLYADKRLGTGEPALEHALGAVSSLAALRLDAETRIAGILFAAPQYLADGQD
jgi:GTP pyrophosphokinase